MSQSNELKLVPAEVSREILSAFHLQWDGRAETLWVDLLAYIGAQNSELVVGEQPEILGYRYDSTSHSSKCLPVLREEKMPGCRDHLWNERELIDRVHVSRLLARIAELEAQLAAAGGAQ